MQQTQRGQHLKELEDDAHVFAAPGRQLIFAHLVHGFAGHNDLAGRWPVNAGDHVEQRDLPLPDGPTIETNSPGL